MAQRTWFITGVSNGFGRHITEQLLMRWDRVIGTVRDMRKVTDLLERYPETNHAELRTMRPSGVSKASSSRSPRRLRLSVSA